nr:scoloptoxin SSD976-like [Dermacentor andersoni]
MLWLTWLLQVPLLAAADTTPNPHIPKPADFCKAPYNQTHVMCAKPYDTCTTFFANTSFMKESILWVHNHYRSHLALGRLSDFPSAGNMLMMQWNEELSRVAEAMGRLCTGQTGVVRPSTQIQYSTAEFPVVGCNIQAQWTNQMTMPIIWRFVVRDWFDQNLEFPKEQIRVFNAPVHTDEFSQLVAADVYALGCSYTRNIVPNVRKSTKNAFIYVCLYGPKGYEKGKPLYHPAPTCSTCPDDTVCNVTLGLCVLQKNKPGAARPLPPEEPKSDRTEDPVDQAEPVEDSAPEAVAVAVASPLAAAVMAVYMWRHGAA